jgi:hypothetical protein
METNPTTRNERRVWNCRWLTPRGAWNGVFTIPTGFSFEVHPFNVPFVLGSCVQDEDPDFRFVVAFIRSA